jgi:hypothetical protein
MSDVADRVARDADISDQQRATFVEACMQGARVHAVLTFGFPVCQRIPALSSSEQVTLSPQTKLIEGMPIGYVKDGKAFLHSHVSFIVWYAATDGKTVELVGVEAVPGVGTEIAPTTKHVTMTYSVIWKPADPALSSLFPGWGALSHREWFAFANTVMLFVCIVVSLLAWAVQQSRFVTETEEQLSDALASRHMMLEPVSLPLRFLLYYCAVAVAMFCVILGALILLATALSLAQGSGALYRIFAVAFPLISAVVAFSCGVNAIFLANAIKVRLVMPLSRILVRLAIGAWAGHGLFIVGTWLRWGSMFLTLPYCLAMAALFGLCCVLMWLGAFVTRLLFAARKQPTFLSSLV